jgi:transposase
MKKRSARPSSAPPSLSIINPDAAGIDVGSEQILVAVPPDRDAQPVRTFTTFTSDLQALSAWLKQCRIKTVAMESTGIYWIPIFEILEDDGFEVCGVLARHVKNVAGKKSDVLDCQWLQQLHTFGLLAPSFRPPEEICALRALVRHRNNLLHYRAAHIQHMQKALHLMNIQLDNVISDITGTTGLQIIRSILSGERDPQVLSQFRDPHCRSTAETIAKSLVGNYRSEHLFALRQAVELYDFYTEQIRTCDAEIEKYYQQMDDQTDPDQQMPPPKRHTKREKNDPAYDLRSLLFRCCGVDLTQVPGLKVLSVQTLFSEIGVDLRSRFPSAKHFASWLALSPNQKVSGGRVLSSKTNQKRNRAAQALRLAARSLHHSQSGLGAYYRRMRARLGPAKANVATAHKLARIIYHMLTRQVEYDGLSQKEYEERYRARAVKNLRRRAREFGMQLVPAA